MRASALFLFLFFSLFCAGYLDAQPAAFPDAPPVRVAIAPDGRTAVLMINGENGGAVIFDPDTGSTIRRIEADSQRVSAQAYDPSLEIIAAADPEKDYLGLYGTATGLAERRLSLRIAPVAALEFHPEEDWLAAGGGERITVWDLRPNVQTHQLKVDGARVNCLEFGYGAGSIHAGLSDGTLAELDWRTGRRNYRTRVDDSALVAMAYRALYAESPMAVASKDGGLFLVNPHSGAPLRNLESGGTPVRALEMDGEEKFLAAGNDLGVIGLWRLKAGMRAGELYGHTGPVYSVDFAGSSNRVISAGADGTVRLWDALAEAEIRSFSFDLP